MRCYNAGMAKRGPIDDAERLRLTLRWQQIEESLQRLCGDAHKSFTRPRKIEEKLLEERQRIKSALGLTEFLLDKQRESK